MSTRTEWWNTDHRTTEQKEADYAAFLKREREIKYLLLLDRTLYGDEAIALVDETAQGMAKLNAGPVGDGVDWTRLRLCYDCGGSGASRYAMSYSCIVCEGHGYYPNKKTIKPTDRRRIHNP